MLQITAEEINFILYQYLQESGFSHSAYTFGKECNIIENKFRHFHIPAGMLIIFLEKALSLIHIETHFNDGDDMIVCNEPFTLLNPHHCSTVSTIKKTGALNQSSIAQNPLDSIMGAAANAEHKVSFGLINLQETKEYDQEMQDESKHAEYDAAGSLMSKNKGEIVHGASSVRQTALLQDSGSKLKILQSNSDTSVKVAWNPKNHMLAFGGDNACAYLWNMDDNLEKATKISSLPHLRPEMPNSTVSIEQSTVTTVNWKPDGKIFVTGASDGILRLWDQNGDLGAIMMNDASIPAKSKDHVGNDGFATNGTNESAGHNKADQGSFDTIYDAKWNKDGSNLVTVSEKNNVILWNNEGKLRASYQGHTDSVVGIDWKNNNNFATASQDGIIKVWDVQSSQSMKTYNAHDGAVKGIKWDHSGALLASGSADGKIKIWSTKHDKPLYTFEEHSEMITSLKWSPTGVGTNLENIDVRLASSSVDGKIKIWNVGEGKGMDTLSGHSGMAMCLDFDPTFKYLASGDDSGRIFIWSVKDGTIIKAFENKQKKGIFDAQWSHDGLMLATGYKDVSVIDIRYM